MNVGFIEIQLEYRWNISVFSAGIGANIKPRLSFVGLVWSFVHYS